MKASLETFFGLGLIVGPTVGGALYEIGGYTVPFAVMGSCLFMAAILTNLVLPHHEQGTDRDQGREYDTEQCFLHIIKRGYSSVHLQGFEDPRCSAGVFQYYRDEHVDRFPAGYSGTPFEAVLVVAHHFRIDVRHQWGHVRRHSARLGLAVRQKFHTQSNNSNRNRFGSGRF